MPLCLPFLSLQVSPVLTVTQKLTFKVNECFLNIYSSNHLWNKVDIYNKIMVFHFSSTLVSLVHKIIQKLLLKTIVYFASLAFEVVIDVFCQYTKKFTRIIFAFKRISRVNDRMIERFYFEIII